MVSTRLKAILSFFLLSAPLWGAEDCRTVLSEVHRAAMREILAKNPNTKNNPNYYIGRLETALSEQKIRVTSALKRNNELILIVDTPLRIEEDNPGYGILNYTENINAVMDAVSPDLQEASLLLFELEKILEKTRKEVNESNFTEKLMVHAATHFTSGQAVILGWGLGHGWIGVSAAATIEGLSFWFRQTVGKRAHQERYEEKLADSGSHNLDYRINYKLIAEINRASGKTYDQDGNPRVAIMFVYDFKKDFFNRFLEVASQEGFAVLALPSK